MLIKSECDEKLEDAKQSQLQQANLVERLRVRTPILSDISYIYCISQTRLFLFKNKVVEFRKKYESSNAKVVELSHVANQAQIRFKDTNEVLKTLEDRIRITEVSHLQSGGKLCGFVEFGNLVPIDLILVIFGRPILSGLNSFWNQIFFFSLLVVVQTNPAFLTFLYRVTNKTSQYEIRRDVQIGRGGCHGMR